jgi:hypothetical protein
MMGEASPGLANDDSTIARRSSPVFLVKVHTHFRSIVVTEENAVSVQYSTIERIHETGRQSRQRHTQRKGGTALSGVACSIYQDCSFQNL